MGEQRGWADFSTICLSWLVQAVHAPRPLLRPSLPQTRHILAVQSNEMIQPVPCAPRHYLLRQKKLIIGHGLTISRLFFKRGVAAICLVYLAKYPDSLGS
jgi:hypothetical protein